MSRIVGIWYLITGFLLCCSCKPQREHNLKNQIIPVYSLTGEPLDSASLIFYDQSIRHHDLSFRRFELKFQSPQVHEWLNLEGKYWHQSSDLILIASELENRITHKVEIIIDTLIKTNEINLETNYRIKRAYYGFDWWSKRLTEGPRNTNEKAVYFLEVEDLGAGYGPKCIFAFDSALKILNFNTSKLESIKNYR